MATMDRPSRIVRCPKCLALLQEPPPGTPLYKCGNCSTVLRAKHASVDGSRRPITRGQQQNRPTPPGHADSPDNRRVPSKPVPPDHMSRPPALGDPGDQSNRTGNNRPTPVDIGKRLPSQAHHGSFPPGPTPLQVPHGSNTNDGNGLRPGRDHHRLSPRDSLAAQGSGDADSRRGREGPTFMPQTKTSSPVRVEEVQPGGKPPNFVLHKLPAPPVNQIRNPAVKYDITGEKEGVADLRTRNTPINADISTRQKSPPVTPAADAPLLRRPPADVPIQGSVNRERERQRKPEDEKDDPPYSPSKALAALHQQNTGPLYKVKERQVPALGPTRSSQGLPVVRGRNKSQGDETMGTKNPDFAFQRTLDGVEAGPSTGRSREEMLGVHRRQRSDGVAISDRSAGNGRNPALPVVVRRSVEDDAKELRKLPEEPISRHPALENEKRILPSVEATADKMKGRDDLPSTRADEVTVMQDQKPIARASSSDGAGRLKETNSVSPPKANALEQDLSPTSDSALVRRKQQKEDSDLKARFKEKLGVNRDSFDDEEPEPIILLDDLDHEEFPAQSPRTTKKSLSPPRNLLSPPSFISSKSVFGAGVQRQPEQPSKVKADSRADPDAPSNLQTFPGLPDVLDYDTSDDSSNDADSAYQIVSKPHSEELKYSNNGQGVQPDAIHGNDEGSDDEGEQERTHRKSPNSRSKDQQEIIGSYGPVKSSAGGSPYFRSPESIHDRVSPSQAQASDQRKQEQQGNFTRKSDTHESNSFSFGQGEDSRGSAYAMLKGQTQTVRLQINTPVPERIHVRCRHCSLQLQVPLNLPRSETGVQKLRCGSCWKISRFRLNHLLSPSRSPSPGGSCDISPESSFRLGESNSSAEGTSSRYSGTRSNRETGAQDRVVLRTQSGANLPVPPSARHNPRAASGSKLAIMVSGSSLQSETSKVSTPNTSGDLGPVGSSSQAGGNQNVDMLTSPSAGPAESQAHVFLSPALSSTSQDTSMKDRQQQKTSPDLKILQSSSDSDEEKATAQLKIGPTGAFNPARNPSWSAPETPDFDDGHEFKGLKGFLKKSVKELTKGKKSTQYRRKVVVNGHAVPDDVVKKAEEFAGAIHPGTYWYDFRAGFWGVMGGPCLGMIPPFIDELNFPLARHCSHGKTGVLVNGRELHHKDLELLKKRGLPGTPGKAYNVDIDGRLTEESTGVELKGLGRLAPTLEQTGRGPGMWVPESQRGS